jgi:G patch domain-containing protein 1
MSSAKVSEATEREEPVEEKEAEKKEEDPKVHAARLGMYGPITREVRPWQPERLLCERFGVKDPDPDVHFDRQKSRQPAVQLRV